MHHIRARVVTLVFTAILLLGASIAVTPSTASTVTFSFTGIVERIVSLEQNVSDVADVASVGDPFQVNISYDPSSLGDAHGFYFGPITAITVNYPATSYNVVLDSSDSSGNFIFYQNNILTFDAFIMHAPLDGGPPPTPTADGFHPSAFEIEFVAPHGFLSTDPPSLADIVNARGNLFLSGSDMSTAGIFGSMTPVPLPPAVILFGAGLVALVGLGAGSWRQKKSGLA